MVITSIGGDGALQNTASHQIDLISISKSEGILTGSKHNTLDPVKIPSPVEIRDQ